LLSPPERVSFFHRAPLLMSNAVRHSRDLGHRHGRGVIVNVASMYGVVGPKSPLYQSAYATTKHGAEIPAMCTSCSPRRSVADRQRSP